uniref:Peptidyl-prolyl cis-trans isomerase n=2 Tax=Hemiselmis andersenii TaxID=464988 RepID=A0A6U4IER7_HEMAN
MATSKKRDEVFLDIGIQGMETGRLTIELYSDIVPKTAENFKLLCTGDRGRGQSGKELSYKNTKFHRIIKGFMVQGGDTTAGNGMGGESIYGETFADENLTHRYKHSEAGVLSMANAGKDTNGSQFFILTAPAPHLDGSHVVFGKIVEGFETLMQMEGVAVTREHMPVGDVRIINCGVLS